MYRILLSTIRERRTQVLKAASALLVSQKLGRTDPAIDVGAFTTVINALQLSLSAMLEEQRKNASSSRLPIRKTAGDIFTLYRCLPAPEDPRAYGMQLLRASCNAVIADRPSDAARWLRDLEERGCWPTGAVDSPEWRERLYGTLADVWLRLIRKKGWHDRDVVLERIADLRTAQEEYEQRYLDQLGDEYVETQALELIGLYHVAKAAELLALFTTQGSVDGDVQIQLLLDAQFDRALAICDVARLYEFESLVYLLITTAKILVDNSIWTVTRAVNSKVTQFVRSLVDRGRHDNAIFDVLPPQRRALAEKGLLGSSRRAIVVSLPTSSGKTLIAQFRILQALNQFREERGWVCYLAPTKALVNQITRALRREFTPLGIHVERLSPAVAFDGPETSILQKGQQFDVLVATPEKMDLLVRQRLVSTTERTLALVVVDEAHMLQDKERGLKLELLLATINREHVNAQFLLLTPFIPNAKEIARWLGRQSCDDISVGFDWQPNDRMIAIGRAIKTDTLSQRSHDYAIELNPVHTSKNTITTDRLTFAPMHHVSGTFSQANSVKTIAALTALHLKTNGPIIVMHSRPDWVWTLAEELKRGQPNTDHPGDDLLLVRRFTELEYGSGFPLIDLLDHRIGVHHAGLSDETRALMEWLFENRQLDFLIATTTIAQGVNFPVDGLVMASHCYPSKTGSYAMPTEDFWNIAGRAGRIGQDQLGVVVLVAESDEKEAVLKSYVNEQVQNLNSALIALVEEASSNLGDLRYLLRRAPQWSAFLQYLAHTYNQSNKTLDALHTMEQELRGTLGFQKLREQDSTRANQLLQGIEQYVKYLQEGSKPLHMVDRTGFSIDSIMSVLSQSSHEKSSWQWQSLFKAGDTSLKSMMGILLEVPELRDNLQAVLGREKPNGEKLSLIIKDWVTGKSIKEIAAHHFTHNDSDPTSAMTTCGQNLFGRLTQTASWGLGALLSITTGDLDDETFKSIQSLPSQVYYGVESEEAVLLRMLGIPRNAAGPLAGVIKPQSTDTIEGTRKKLYALSNEAWHKALGESGVMYKQVWKIIEGID